MNELLEYPFRIIGPKPDSIAMARLADYMAEFARLLGSQDHVHFDRIIDRSVAIVARVRPEDAGVISPRIRHASKGTENTDAITSVRKLNQYLGEDGWTAELRLPQGGDLIAFPGTVKTSKTIRIVNQPTTVQGRLVRIQGGGDVIKVGLEIDGDLEAHISVKAAHARDLALCFHQHVRLSGDGRWKRDSDGKWLLDNLNATSFELLQDAPLQQTLAELRDILPKGSGEGLVHAIDAMRSA